MNKHAIYHISDVPYVYGKDKDTLVVRIRVAKEDIKECFIQYKCRYDWDNDYNEKRMKVVAETDLFTYFETELSVERNRYRYLFKLTDFENNNTYYNERGFFDNREEALDLVAFQFPYIAEEDLYVEEKWLQEAVVYQIFPERFWNGDSYSNPEGTKEWGKGKIGRNSMYGGDIRGIIEKLDYISNLGVNLIYLTPVFKSSSNHKYNTADYYEIDPHFGTLEDMKELVKKCHERGMKIIFDAVFNHSGMDFFAFEDVLKNQQESKYKDWYFVDSWPVSTEKCNYYTFANNAKYMPKLNTNNKAAREYLLNVAKYWVKEIDIDGWRLDVCDEVGHDFWRDFRKVVKEAKRDAVIIGEIMHESASFLRGDQLDSIMNYPFKNATIDFFGKGNISARDYLDTLAANRMIYMNSITKQMWNLVGSHDTKRIINECNHEIERVKLAMAMQFTYIGVPYIYYGDEIGLTGEDDPDNRKCMIWDEKKHNKEIYNFCKNMIEIRRENKVLIHGDFEEVYCKDKLIAFTRSNKEEKVLVVFNSSNKEKELSYSLTEEAVDIIDGSKIFNKEVIKMKPLSFKIIKF